jgi:hypothetical protein
VSPQSPPTRTISQNRSVQYTAEGAPETMSRIKKFRPVHSIIGTSPAANLRYHSSKRTASSRFTEDQIYLQTASPFAGGRISQAGFKVITYNISIAAYIAKYFHHVLNILVYIIFEKARNIKYNFWNSKLMLL